MRHQVPLRLFIDRHVRATKAIDGLLRIADQEERARRRDRRSPVGLLGILRSEQHQDLGLKRIRVLELVDEEMGEASLQVATHGCVVAEQVAGAQQQVDEVEAARVPLLALVVLHHRLQLGLKAGRQIGVGVDAEPPQLGHHRVALGEHLDARDTGSELLAVATLVVPARAPIARELAELGLESVVVARAHALAKPVLLHPARDVLQVLREPVVGVGRARRERGQALEGLQGRVDGAIAIEGNATPGGGKVAVLDPIARRSEERLAGALGRRPPRPTTQEAPDALGRLVEGLLEPIVERSLEEAGRRVGSRDLEHRVDARLDRALTKQVAAEGVDRGDARQLEGLEGGHQAPAGLLALRARGCRGTRSFELGPKPQPHLPRGLVGEGERDHRVEARLAARDQGDDATHQGARLAGSCRGLHDEAGVEVLEDAAAIFGVGERSRHASCLRTSRSARAGCHLRAVRSSS